MIAPANTGLFPHTVANNAFGQASLSPSWSWLKEELVTAHATELGIHVTDLMTKSLPEGKHVKFTLYWPDGRHWQGADFVMHVHRLTQPVPAGKT